MAVLGSTYVDLVDVLKGKEGMQVEAKVIEQLATVNPILEDAVAVPCNLGMRHRTTVRSGLPSVAWGRLYQGIAQSKSTKVQVEDTTGFVEGLSSVDTRLLELVNNEGAVRGSEAMSFLESMSQEVSSKVFYGSTKTAPDEFMGLAPRFSDLSARNGGQIVDGGGTGSDNTSIWMVTWGENQCNLLYPENTAAGIVREDHGKQRVLDGNNNPYYVKEESFRWHVGLTVRDWRYVVRIANIDVSDMRSGTVDLYGLLRSGFYKMQNRRQVRSEQAPASVGRIAIYCNRDVKEALDTLSTNAGNSDNFVRLKTMELQGKEIETYRGIPVREEDALLNTEARVV